MDQSTYNVAADLPYYLTLHETTNCLLSISINTSNHRIELQFDRNSGVCSPFVATIYYSPTQEKSTKTGVKYSHSGRCTVYIVFFFVLLYQNG